MHHYYFNLYNDDITEDYEGADLADDDAARAHGIKEARSMAAQCVLEGHLTASHYVEVVDANRDNVATIRFDEAVDLRP
jgi:hypothetical protein